MSLTPFAGGGSAGSGIWTLVSRLLQWAFANKAVVATGATTTALSLQGLRDRAQIEAGASDIQALDEAARTAARMLGLDGSEVLWPMDRLGNSIAPKYFHVDLIKGRAWYTSEYFSRKSVRTLGRRFSGGRRNYRAYANRMRRPR